VASTLILAVWAGSFLHKLGIFSLGMSTNLKIDNGVIELRHIYARGEPVSEKRFFADPKYRGTITLAKPWECSFSAEHWLLFGSSPCKYWQLRFPTPLLLVFVLLFYWLNRGRLRRLADFESAMPSV
jgi:hypothetical protein